MGISLEVGQARFCGNWLVNTPMNMLSSYRIYRFATPYIINKSIYWIILSAVCQVKDAHVSGMSTTFSWNLPYLEHTQVFRYIP